MRRLWALLFLVCAGIGSNALPSTAQPVLEPILSVEEKLRFGERETLEYTFQGNENEIVVIDEQAGIPGSIRLYGPDGELVAEQLRYLWDTVIELGSQDAYRLPATGLYRLESSVLSLNPEENAADYRLSVRIASDYERKMIYVATLWRDGELDTAITSLSQVVEQYPNLPQPYLWRSQVSFELISRGVEIDEDNDFPLDAMYNVYQAMDLDSQMMVVDDLRQTALNLENIEGQLGYWYDFRVLNDMADFLESGEASPYLVKLIEEDLNR